MVPIHVTYSATLPSSVIDTLDADHVTFRGGGRNFLHMTTAGKKTRHVQ